MKRILITGFSGFVARHFVEYLISIDEKASILGVDINDTTWDISSLSSKDLVLDFKKVDLNDEQEVDSLLSGFKPDELLHLASFSSVGFSWKNPIKCFSNNIMIFLNLLEAIRAYCPKCRVLSVGSSEEYGVVTQDKLPCRENQPLMPSSPYAVARVSQEMISKVYIDGYGLDLVMTRSFNHIGPYQSTRFAIPSFIDQAVKIYNSGQKTGSISCGDVDIIRDFVDVRDVVRAYYLLLQKGHKGEIYNICTGKSKTLREVISIIAQCLNIEITIERDPDLYRPSDNPVVYGDYSKINAAIDWHPNYSLEESIQSMINYTKTELTQNNHHLINYGVTNHA